jgi:hypothetical protein
MFRGIIHQTGIVDYEPVHIMKQPPQSVMCPRNDKVDVQAVASQMQESSPYVDDMIAKVPRGVNVGNSLSFGNPMNGGGYNIGGSFVLPKDPGFNPPGGVRYDLSFLKLPDEYNSLLRMRHPDTSIDPVYQAQLNQAVPRPQVIPTKQTLEYEVLPSVVYEVLREVPTLPIPENMYTDRPMTQAPAIHRYSPSFNDVSQSGPNQIDKYVNDKDIIHYLTPIFSTMLQVGDSYIPVTLKNPLDIVIQAQTHSPITLNMEGTGQPVTLKDYTWTIIQPTLSSPAILTLDITASLKDKPDLSHMIEPLLSSDIVKLNQPPAPSLAYTREAIPFELPMQSQTPLITHGDPKVGRESHYYSQYSGSHSLIPDVTQLVDVNVDYLRKPKLTAHVDNDLLKSHPWIPYNHNSLR